MQEVSQETTGRSTTCTTILSMNIMSFNCEGIRTCRDYIYHVLENTACDILCLQETWTLDNTIDTLGTIHDYYAYIGVSGISNEQFICGRPSGGLGILFKKSMVNYIKNKFKKLKVEGYVG